ncbi:MAG: nitrite/sulfite reductase, partial [Rhizobiales bacterium]|nr:nitrite/sulfite reductase [Hyphomicrobiales bacterium]
FSHSEIRVSHHQNLVLPDVKLSDLHEVWTVLRADGMGEANIGLLGDIIACPGLDYCALATARSIPIAQSISRRFSDPAQLEDIGPLRVNISGCINACGHHHVGHIGILGLEKKGKEFYQVTLGGHSGTDASIGGVLGKGFSEDEIAGAIETIVDTYVSIRSDGESFLECVRRVGTSPFKEALYAPA